MATKAQAPKSTRGPVARAGRVRARRKDARPAELIDAGIAEFARRGFAGTRLEDVAARAGVVKGTIYRYFDDKRGLFEAAVRTRAPAFLAAAPEAIAGFEGSTGELLEFVLQRLYAEVIDSDVRILMRILIAEGDAFPELVALYYETAIVHGRALVESIVSRGVSRGEIAAEHAKLLPLMIVAPAMMLAVWRMTFDAKDPLATRDFLDAHLEVLKRGMLRQG